MLTASDSAVGMLIRRMTMPLNTPYVSTAASCVRPEATQRLTSIAESINCDKGTMHEPMVIGMAITISCSAIRLVEAFCSGASCGIASKRLRRRK